MTRTRQDLQMLQALPLDLKISMTKARIRQWLNEFGEEGVYVSFSGGKDSTVLLHLVREMYPRVPAVFCDTGLEYPEIRDFVKTFENVTWLRPKMNFRQVIEKYGYPFISKEVSECVYGARKYLIAVLNEQGFDRQTDHKHSYDYEWRKLCGLGEFAKRLVESDPLSLNAHAAMMMGAYTIGWGKSKKEGIPSKDRSMFSCERYQFF